MRRKTRGFTLIEVLVVVTIIIIMAGFAMPTISSFLSNRKLKAITGRLTRCLLQARAKAITEHNNTYAIFLNDRIVVLGERASMLTSQKYFQSDKESAGMQIRLRFAGETLSADKAAPQGVKSDLPAMPEADWSGQAVSALQFMRHGSFKEGTKHVYMKFMMDGTIQLVSADGPGDVFSLEFMSNPATNADLIVEEIGMDDRPGARGWIDIRATGNVSQKVQVGRLTRVTETKENK